MLLRNTLHVVTDKTHKTSSNKTPHIHPLAASAEQGQPDLLPEAMDTSLTAALVPQGGVSPANPNPLQVRGFCLSSVTSQPQQPTSFRERFLSQAHRTSVLTNVLF